MGVFSGPDVSESGLVLALDAANSKSYDSNENLLTYSEQFDNGAWSKVSTTVSTNATAAPNGTLTADNVTNTPNSLSYLAQNKTGLSTTTTYTASVYVKPLTTNKVVAFEWGGAWRSFNLSNLTDTGGGGTGQITVLDNGWYRISHTVTNVTSFNVIYIGAYGTTADTVTVALWGAQLEIGSSASPYYATTASAKNRGTTWTDLSGNANTGTLTNGPTYSISNGGSIVFDGTNDYLLTSSVATYGNNTTWEAWIYCTGNVSTYNMFMGRYLPYFGFYTGNSFIFSNNISGTQQTIYTATNLLLNTWYHATFTTSYNGTNTTMKTYTNGTETATGTFAGAQGNYSNKFMVGDGNNGSDTSWFPFPGRVSNVKVYNRTLTAAEIRQNFNANRGRYGI